MKNKQESEKKKHRRPWQYMRIRTMVTVTTLLTVFLPVAISIVVGLVFEERIRTYLIQSSIASQGYIGDLIYSKVGYVLIGIVMIYILSIIAFSFITSRAITIPIEKLARGVDEIAGGNIDYVIDYESNNEIGITVKAFNDMTNQLRISTAQKESVERSRKQMINGVAHDLRTPLTSIKGYVEGLRDGIANTPEKQERYIQTIYSSVLDIERLLDELLSLSRLETGNIDLITEPVNIVALLQDFANETAFDLEKKNFTCTFHKPESDVITVMLDCNRFSRVLANVVSNSVKYSKKNIDGRIDISIKEFENNIILSISDNGIGIESENLPHIFDTFYRADIARTRVREGSGIGLSVCKLIVEKHGGRIWANSTPDEGTTIQISLDKITENDNEKTSTDR